MPDINVLEMTYELVDELTEGGFMDNNFEGLPGREAIDLLREQYPD